MEKSFKIHEKRLNSFLESISLLENSDSYLEASILIWNVTRFLIFKHLEYKGIHYDSTKEAFSNFIFDSESDLANSSMKLYLYGIICGWDSSFEIHRDDYLKIRREFNILYSKLSYGNPHSE